MRIMRVGILGLSGAGKKTLFRLLTGGSAAAVTPAGLPGICKVQDPRVDILSRIYNPKKTTYAQTDLLLLPDAEKTEGKAPWLEEVRKLDGLICVVRSFNDETVFHPQGSVDPKRDIAELLSELLLSDMVFLEKRLERLADEMKAKRTADKEKELEMVKKLLGELEAGNAVNTAAFSETERRILSPYPFLSNRTAIVAVNIAQGAAIDDLGSWVKKNYGQRTVLTALDAKLESEIADISDEAERREFLQGLGIAEPATARLTRVIYDALGLMSYFTVGTDEVRAWTVRKNSSAPEAARAIHSALERGFIRVEVMAYKDLIELGSEEAVKSAGKWSLKGKDYVVQDGDVLSFRSGT
ncbi:MAG: redox-regulated ATPase YchF [Elusimicrobia bacterium]|nr:redox-regulated ATPase YchF [Elusimicrobiota bacterium]